MGKQTTAGLRKLSVIKDGKVVTKGQLKEEKKKLNGTDRLTLEWINNFLSVHRDQIQQTKVTLETGVIANEVLDKDSDIKSRPVFPQSYMSFKQLPKWWMADFLVDTLGFPKKQLDALDETDPSHAVKKLFVFCTGLGESIYWPRPCLKKVVLVQFAFHFATKVLKDRFKRAKVELAKPARVINYGLISPYDYKWSGPTSDGSRELLGITHVASGEKAVDPLPARVFSDYRVACEYDDMLMQFVGKARYKPLAKDLFPEGAQAFQVWTKDSVTALGTRLANELGQAEGDGEKRKPGKGVLTTVVAKQTERLRQKQKEKTPLKKVTAPLTITP